MKQLLHYRYTALRKKIQTALVQPRFIKDLFDSAQQNSKSVAVRRQGWGQGGSLDPAMGRTQTTTEIKVIAIQKATTEGAQRKYRRD
jgi:hypothetical protein